MPQNKENWVWKKLGEDQEYKGDHLDSIWFLQVHQVFLAKLFDGYARFKIKKIEFVFG